MQKRRMDIELMAPAGSFESLMAAIQGGANAVYVGLEDMNMRSGSAFNFTLKDLNKAIKISTKNHVKTYLALNTVMYDTELQAIRKILSQAKKMGISAVIVSDQAVIGAARELNIPVHISTQLNISNFESLKFYSGYADVVVPARELNIDQVAGIVKMIRKNNLRGPSGNLIKIELFIHGALCMAVSGKCYLSLHQYNYSANRGKCLQACRRSYEVKERETGKTLAIENEYIMSPKDLCTIPFLDRILDAGVSVLKIEGRARSPEYVKTVTSCYSEAIDAWLRDDYTEDKINQWEKRLETVFNRGFWDGYYLGRKTGEWSSVYGSASSKRKIYLAKGLNYFSRIKVAEFLMETGTLEMGDEIFIIGPTTGVIETIIGEIRVDDKKVTRTVKGERFSIPIGQPVRRSDKLYKLVEAPG